MKIDDILVEAPKKKVGKKKTVKKANPYKPQEVATIDLHDAAVRAAKKIADFIRTNCKPWLVTSKKGELVVYRGISDRKGLAFTKKTRTDRKPKDTDRDTHIAFNAAIAAAGGVANRSNSLFGSSRRSTASMYGVPYVLIPVGQFNYTWSPKWEDWTNDSGTDSLLKLLQPKAQSPEVQKKIKELNAMQGAWRAKKKEEIMAKVKKELKEIPARIKAKEARIAGLKNKHGYLASDLRYEIQELKDMLRRRTGPGLAKHVQEKLKNAEYWDSKSPANQIRRLKERDDHNERDLLNIKLYDPAEVKKAILADQHLDRAIKSGKEIMISCSKGLYIRPNFYQSYVLPVLQGKKITATTYAPNKEPSWDEDYNDDW